MSHMPTIPILILWDKKAGSLRRQGIIKWWDRSNTRKIKHNKPCVPWWRLQMETFSALLAICAECSPVTGEFPAQRPVTRSFDVSFDLCLNKRLSKHSWGWWFETSSSPLWYHYNAICTRPTSRYPITNGSWTNNHYSIRQALFYK